MPYETRAHIYNKRMQDCVKFRGRILHDRIFL